MHIVRTVEFKRVTCTGSVRCRQQLYVNGKGKVHPRIGHKGLEGELRYGSTLSLTSALDGGGSLTPRPHPLVLPWE